MDEKYTISPDNCFANVPICDKFGAWPAQTGETYFDSQVGTWFTVWWTKEGESTYEHHWFNECRLKPVDYGYYASNDPDYLESVFARLKSMGIDFLVLDDTNGHWNDYGLIRRNMWACFEQASRMGKFAPQIAIATGDPVRNEDYAGQQKEFDAYYEMKEKYPEVFYQYEGKPFLLMYVAHVAGARYDDNRDRFTLRYGTGYISWQNFIEDTTLFTTQGNWGWVWDMQNPGTEIMGVQPGYNKPHHAFVARENGKHYIEQWLAAIKANPKVIMLPSYNDHCEETGWEATVPMKPPLPDQEQDVEGADPYLYEKITEAYLALRYGYIEGFYYQAEDDSQIYQCVHGELVQVDYSASLGEPIILIPSDYVAWKANRKKG